MIDGVELILIHQPQEMRKFHRHDAGRFQQNLEAANKIVEVGHVREHIFCSDQISGFAGGFEPLCGRSAKKGNVRRNAFLLRRSGDVRRRFDAENWNPPLLEELQQISVVAGDFDHVRARTQFETIRHQMRVGFAMS